MRAWGLVLVAVAGLMGAAGVVAAASAAHGTGGDNLQTAANFLLFHAALVAALGLAAGTSAAFLAAGTLAALGVTIFSGDLALLATTGARLFPLAAPVGGLLMIAAWLALTGSALAALLRRAA